MARSISSTIFDAKKSKAVKASSPGDSTKAGVEIRLRQGESGGHVVEHHFTGGEYQPPKVYPFGEGDGQKLVDHLVKHANINVKTPPVDGKAKASPAKEEEGE